MIGVLVDRRKTLKLTRQELSEKIKIHYVTMCKYESGSMEPSLSNFLLWVSALDCDMRVISKEREL